MKCPHCCVEINSNFKRIEIAGDSEGFWYIYHMICPNLKCRKVIVELGKHKSTTEGRNQGDLLCVRPLLSTRAPVPLEVDEDFARDYKEACLVSVFSPKASAALSRRCLQNILREKAGIKEKTLADEIKKVIDSKTLPSYLSDSIDAVRNIGNFAAHPTKSTSTGEIVEVEPGEAEWLLDVLESLFDFYFVQPAILQTKKDALNKKLTDAGKPPMK